MTTRSVQIFGPIGIGKTTLATKLRERGIEASGESGVMVAPNAFRVLLRYAGQYMRETNFDLVLPVKRGVYGEEIDRVWAVRVDAILAVLACYDNEA